MNKPYRPFAFTSSNQRTIPLVFQTYSAYFLDVFICILLVDPTSPSKHGLSQLKAIGRLKSQRNFEAFIVFHQFLFYYYKKCFPFRQLPFTKLSTLYDCCVHSLKKYWFDALSINLINEKLINPHTIRTRPLLEPTSRQSLLQSRYLERQIGGPILMPIRYQVNFFKGATFIWIIFLMFCIQNYTIEMYIYLLLHGSYGIFWIIKDHYFPDARVQK